MSNEDMTGRSRPNTEDPLQSTVATLRFQRAFGDGPRSDEELAETLTKAGLEVTDRSIATLREVAGPWLPEPLGKPRRRLWSRPVPHSDEVFTELLDAVSRYRSCMQAAGTARLRFYRAQGISPQTLMENWPQQIPDRAAYDAACSAWDTAMLAVRRANELLGAALARLPRRDSGTRQLVTVWTEISSSLYYYQAGSPGRDFPALEDCALSLIAASRDDRAPRGAARQLSQLHTRCVTRALEPLESDFKKLVQISSRLRQRPPRA